MHHKFEFGLMKLEDPHIRGRDLLLLIEPVAEICSYYISSPFQNETAKLHADGKNPALDIIHAFHPSPIDLCQLYMSAQWVEYGARLLLRLISLLPCKQHIPLRFRLLQGRSRPPVIGTKVQLPLILLRRHLQVPLVLVKQGHLPPDLICRSFPLRPLFLHL